MRFRSVLYIPVLMLLTLKGAFAQVDPRVPLGLLIQAFQNCGPPAVYQMLSPQLWQLVYVQTGGSGCFAQIRAAGPVQAMQVLDQQVLPNGTVWVVRVVHLTGATVDWFIGINRLGKVEVLTFQNPQQAAPSVATGPVLPLGGGIPTAPAPATPTPVSPAPSPPAQPPTGGGGNTNAGCALYPAMCQ
jgi:hypothetical protein